jgi:two-component system, LytTR family, response regulator
MKKIRILIVDDEPLARAVVREYLAAYPEAEIVAECRDGFECIKAVKAEKPDLLFLDIQMPKIDGFEMLEILDEKPEIIFATAYDQYAIKAFETNAVDYLLKPFSRERLEAAYLKAKERILKNSSEGKTSVQNLQQSHDSVSKVIERVIIRKGSQIIVVPVDKIKYIEAQGDYVMIYTGDTNYLKEKTMKFYEDNLPAEMFARIHRSYIVNITLIDKLELYEKETYMIILKDGSKLRASREGYKKLKGMM